MFDCDYKRHYTSLILSEVAIYEMPAKRPITTWFCEDCKEETNASKDENTATVVWNRLTDSYEDVGG